MGGKTSIGAILREAQGVGFSGSTAGIASSEGPETDMYAYACPASSAAEACKQIAQALRGKGILLEENGPIHLRGTNWALKVCGPAASGNFSLEVRNASNKPLAIAPSPQVVRRGQAPDFSWGGHTDPRAKDASQPVGGGGVMEVRFRPPKRK